MDSRTERRWSRRRRAASRAGAVAVTLAASLRRPGACAAARETLRTEEVRRARGLGFFFSPICACGLGGLLGYWVVACGHRWMRPAVQKAQLVQLASSSRVSSARLVILTS